jgi:predicted PurR-regulated permease PerM
MGANEDRTGDGPAAREDAPAAADRSLVERLAELHGERLYRAVGLLFLLALLFMHFAALARVLLIAFVAAILAVAFNAAVQRLPLRRGAAVLVVIATTLAIIVLASWLAVSALVGQVRQLIDDFPAIIETTEDWVQDKLGLEIDLLGERARAFVTDAVGASDTRSILTGAFGIVELLALTVLVLVGSFYVVYKPNEQLLTPLMRAVPQHRRPAVRRMFSLIGERLSGWLWGTLVCMVAAGAMAVVAFYLLGTPYPLLLGVLVGVTDIVPIIGPWIGGIVAVAVTLFTDPQLALWVALAVLIIQEIESNVVRPLVMSKSARLHPFVSLLALLLFGSLFGILGAVLSLPLILVIATMVQVLWVEEVLDAGDDEIEPVVDIRPSSS